MIIIKPRKTLHLHWSGPLVQYGDGTLFVENLNPQISTKWRMTRVEMLRFGLRVIWAGLTRSNAHWNRDAKVLARCALFGAVWLLVGSLCGLSLIRMVIA